MKRYLALFVVVLLLTGCGLFRSPSQVEPGPETDPDREFVRPELQDLPQEVKEWVENSKTMFIGHSMVHGDRRYIMVSYGERPTGGFSVQVEDVVDEGDKLVVPVRFQDPQPGEEVTQAITTPKDVIYILDTETPLEFVATGDMTYVPTLIGIDLLPPIVAQSDLIKVFTPAPDETVEDSFTVEGVANVFEGNLNYILLDHNQRHIEEGNTTAGMGDWYHFELDITLPAEGEGFYLELFTYSAKDGEVENHVRIPLNREQAQD